MLLKLIMYHFCSEYYLVIGISPTLTQFFSFNAFLMKNGIAQSAGSPLPGSGDVPIPGHLRHMAHSEPNGTVQNRVPWSSALDEGCVPGVGS